MCGQFHSSSLKSSVGFIQIRVGSLLRTLVFSGLFEFASVRSRTPSSRWVYWMSRVFTRARLGFEVLAGCLVGLLRRSKWSSCSFVYTMGHSCVP